MGGVFLQIVFTESESNIQNIFFLQILVGKIKGNSIHFANWCLKMYYFLTTNKYAPSFDSEGMHNDVAQPICKFNIIICFHFLKNWYSVFTSFSVIDMVCTIYQFPS